MAQTKAPAGAKLTQSANAVDKLILEAGKASATMTAKSIEAAKLAAAELDMSKPLADRIAAVVAAHATAFATAGHNVKAIFSDALTLLAAPSDKVMVPTFDAAGRKVADVQETITADKAVNLAKHTMRDAAKQVREHAGIGRKVAPRTPAAKVTKEPDSALMNRVLSELADALKIDGFADRMIRVLDVAGFVCARKVKVTKVADKPAPVKTMADLPGLMVQGTASA